jgi:hypothetical protein
MSDSPRAQQHRHQARACGSKRRNSPHPPFAREAEEMARQYEALADNIEEREKRHQGSD